MLTTFPFRDFFFFSFKKSNFFFLPSTCSPTGKITKQAVLFLESTQYFQETFLALKSHLESPQ